MKHSFVFAALLAIALAACSKSPQQSATTQNAAAPEVAETFAFYRKSDKNTAKAGLPSHVKVVEGELKGLVIQKSAVKESPSEKNPGQTSYTGSYSLINGGEIDAIDDQGVHKQGRTIVLLTVSQDGKPYDDAEVLQIGLDMPQGAFFGSFTKEGGSVFRISGTGKPTVSADAVIGEFRVEPGNTKGRLIPALEATTDSGVITIPVKNFIAFKATPAEPKKP